MEEDIKEKFALGIFIFSIIALLAFAIIAFQSPQNKMTGKAIDEANKKGVEIKENKITCIDSDNGKNYFVGGVIEYCDSNGCLSKEDSCSGKKLTEWYCNNNEKNYEEHECEFDCDNGICINLVKDYQYKWKGGSGGGGGGSGVGSSSTNAETFQTYNLGELTSENTLEVLKNEKIKFSITGQGYILALTDNTESQATISFSDGQTFTINAGSDKNIDLNSDGTSELYIKISSINVISHKVKLMLRKI